MSGVAKKIKDQDGSFWLQLMIAAIPVLLYLWVYTEKLVLFEVFNLPKELIRIRFEDILFIGTVLIALTIAYWQQIFDFVSDGDKFESLEVLLSAVLMLALLVLTILFANVEKQGNWQDDSHIAVTVVGWAISVLLLLILLKKLFFKNISNKRRNISVIALVLLLVWVIVLQEAFIKVHTSKYMVADSKVVVAYLDDSLAITKDIIALNDDGTSCTLGCNFYIDDISGWSLENKNLGYINFCSNTRP